LKSRVSATEVQDLLDRTISPLVLSLVREDVDLAKITGTYGSERASRV